MMSGYDLVERVVRETLQMAVRELDSAVRFEALMQRIPVSDAWRSIAGSQLLSRQLREGLMRGYALAWEHTGRELMARLKQRPGFAAAWRALGATQTYATRQIVDLPDPGETGWRTWEETHTPEEGGEAPYPISRQTWEWLAEHEQRLAQTIPVSYMRLYADTRVPFLAQRIERHLAEAYQRINAESRERGFGIRETMELVRRRFTQYTTWRLENVARTESAVLYETGHLGRYLEDVAVQGVRYYAVMDSRTTEICRALDGRAWRLDDREAIVQPPAHYQCRSTLAPVLFDERARWDDGSLPPGVAPLEGFGEPLWHALPDNNRLVGRPLR